MRRQFLIAAILLGATSCSCGDLQLFGVRDAGPKGCSGDGDCTGIPGKGKCDVSSHACVACLPSDASACAAGQICNGNACVPGCKTDADCHAGNPSPASMGDDLCNPTTMTCVQCISYSNCPSGEVCNCSGECAAPGPEMLCLDCSKPCKTLTVNGNGFNQGTITSLHVDPTSGLSTIPASTNPPLQQTPWLWMPNDGNNPVPGSVSKIDARTGALIGTYSSGGQGPSRGAMPLDGSFWVGNRCPWNATDPTCSNLSHLAADGSLLCTVGQAADGQGTPFIRGVALDAKGYVWFSSWNDHRIHKVDPVTCKAILDIDLANNPGGLTFAYGLIVDPKGILWNSSASSGPFVGIDTNTGAFVYSVDNQGQYSYGITADPAGNIWYASYCSHQMLMIDASTHTLHTFPGGPGDSSYCARGVSVDTSGTVWSAWWSSSGEPNYVTKWNATSGFLGSFAQNTISNGVAIDGDTFGNVWLAGTLADGTQGAIRFPKTITADNQYEVLNHMTAGWPYSYADLTGIVFRTVTSNNPQFGFWVLDFDGGSPNPTWERATWNAVQPAGTAINVRFFGSSTSAGLQGAAACGPFTTSPVDLTTCNFHNDEWLGIEVSLQTNDVSTQPSINDLQVFYQQ